VSDIIYMNTHNNNNNNNNNRRTQRRERERARVVSTYCPSQRSAMYPPRIGVRYARAVYVPYICEDKAMAE
jgi:hypothetical protein